jgi:hypothetical protein
VLTLCFTASESSGWDAGVFTPFVFMFLLGEYCGTKGDYFLLLDFVKTWAAFTPLVSRLLFESRAAGRED